MPLKGFNLGLNVRGKRPKKDRKDIKAPKLGRNYVYAPRWIGQGTNITSSLTSLRLPILFRIVCQCICLFPTLFYLSLIYSPSPVSVPPSNPSPPHRSESRSQEKSNLIGYVFRIEWALEVSLEAVPRMTVFTLPAYITSLSQGLLTH